MKRFIMITLCAALGAAACAAVYCGIVVLNARHATPAIIQKAVSSDAMKLRSADLSAWQLNALLAVEDPNFYHHKGVDLKTPGAGLTTITQGLVKFLYFEKFKPGLAKIRQTLIARFALDPLVPKDTQLEILINYIYLGNAGAKQVYGLADAAQAYYHKPFSGLNEDEYLSIVAMIIAPNNFNIITASQANAERVARIRKVLSGEYKPKGLMDIYYGPLDTATQKGLAPASYFPSTYHK